MTAQRWTRRRSPIVVRRFSHVLTTGWLWSCDACPRRRGYHHSSRRKDWLLARYGKPPDAPPRERALDAAGRHWHEFHAPEPCRCCSRAHRPTGKN